MRPRCNVSTLGVRVLEVVIAGGVQALSDRSADSIDSLIEGGWSYVTKPRLRIAGLRPVDNTCRRRGMVKVSYDPPSLF